MRLVNEFTMSSRYMSDVLGASIHQGRFATTQGSEYQPQKNTMER